MTGIAERLGAMEVELRRLGCRSAELLEPATSSDAAGRHLPPVVREFFAWRGGTRNQVGTTVGDAYFIPGYIYPSLDEAVATRHAHGEGELGPDWMPLFVAPSGDCFAAVWTEDRVEVVDILIGEPTQLVFDTVEEFLDALIDAFRSGGFFVDERGVLDLDPDQFVLIGRPLP